MGYWAHSWQLSEVMVRTTSQVVPDRTLDEWNSYPYDKYTNQSDVHMFCVYDDHEMPGAAWPASKKYCDLMPDVIHECTGLPDPDPYLVWVDDEGNLMSPDAAPQEAKSQMPKNGNKK